MYSRLLESASNAHSKAWCGLFASKFLLRLPREMRDIIYGYLIGPTPHVVKIVPPHQDLHNPDWMPHAPPTREYGPFHVSNGGADVPHFLNKRYIGQQFATEISQEFYRCVVFQVEDSSSLDHFLVRDIFNTGVIPKHHLHRLELILSVPKIEDAGGCIPELERGVTKAQCLEAVKPLSTLLTVKHKHEFDLRIIVKCYEEASAAKFQEAMLPVVHRLKVAGFQVRADHLSPFEGIRPSSFQFNFDLPLD